MMILGVDPGVQNVGFAFFNTSINNFAYFESYNIDTKELNFEGDSVESKRKYFNFYSYLLSFIGQVDVVAIEKPFFLPQTLPNNIRTLEAIGIIKLSCEFYEIPYKEYSPAAIKKEVTGNGRAKKELMISTLNEMFKLKLISTHLVDAGAVAYTFYKKEIFEPVLLSKN